MNRRKFLKRFGLGATAVVVAPHLLATPLPAEKVLGHGLFEQIRNGNVHSYNELTKESLESTLSGLTEQNHLGNMWMTHTNYRGMKQFHRALERQFWGEEINLNKFLTENPTKESELDYTWDIKGNKKRRIVTWKEN